MKSVCQPRDFLVDIFQEFPEDTEHTYIPSCVVLKRCGGCCTDEAMECVPTESQKVTLQVRPGEIHFFFPGVSSAQQLQEARRLGGGWHLCFPTADTPLL